MKVVVRTLCISDFFVGQDDDGSNGGDEPANGVATSKKVKGEADD